MALHRWKGGNGPEQTDSIATGNLIRATPKGVKRFVLVTSAGVERFNKLPFSILNLFGIAQLALMNTLLSCLTIATIQSTSNSHLLLSHCLSSAGMDPAESCDRR